MVPEEQMKQRLYKPVKIKGSGKNLREILVYWGFESSPLEVLPSLLRHPAPLTKQFLATLPASSQPMCVPTEIPLLHGGESRSRCWVR